MLSKIVRAAPPALSLAYRSSRKQYIQLFYRPIYSFSTNPNGNPKPQKKQTPEPQEKPNTGNKSNEESPSFTEFMQEPEKQPTTNYVYTNKEVYSIKSEYKYFAARQRGDIFMMVLMMSAGVISYLYIHPLLTVVPLWFMAGSFVSLLGARKMSKSLCKSMELLNNIYVKLRMLSGEEMMCKIEEIQILGIKDWSPAKKRAAPVNSYIVLGYFKDVHSKVPKEVRLIVANKVTKIENIDLFRAIMHKDIKELQKFELKEGEKISKDPTKTKYQFDFSEEEIDNLEKEVKTSKKDKEAETK